MILCCYKRCTAQLNWHGDIINAKLESSHSKEVSVVLGKSFEGNILKSYECDGGRVLIVSVELNDELFHTISVYAPNTETE